MQVPAPTFTGDVKDGKLHLRDPERFKRWVAKLEGEITQITVKKAKQTRSNQQNKYYFGVVVALIADFCGFTPDEAHEALKWQFLRINHAKIPTVRSTASLTKAEFVDYTERVKVWAASELGVVIPDPSQVDLDSL